MSSHILVQDPSSISTRFSISDMIGYDGDGDAESDLERLIEQNLAPEEEPDLEVNKPNFTLIEPYLDRIPPREADLIRLYYRDEMKQEQIARLFSITQAAVSYRLARGRRRIQFLFTIPELESDTFEEELESEFTGQDREILWRMYETTCQSEVAKQMGLTQGRVRHRFFRSLGRIKELIIAEAREPQAKVHMLRKQIADPNQIVVKLEDIEAAEMRLHDIIDNSIYSKYYTVFFAISDKHFNILHEVSLPQFKDRGDAQILTIE
jgi:DNA-directed RNA polymerase specialized sigma24 family protein